MTIERKRVLWDIVMYSGGIEADILELRVDTLSELRDELILRHGLVCSSTTFSGIEREIELSPWIGQLMDVIRHVDPPSSADTAWGRERWTRDKTAIVAGDLSGDPGRDLFLVADLDEIPHPDAIRAAHAVVRDGETRGEGTALKLEGAYYNWALNLRAVGSPGYAWEYNQPVISSLAFVLSMGASAFRQAPGSPHHIDVPVLAGSRLGWHFSSMGTPEDVLGKLQAYSHADEYGGLPVEELRRRLEDRRDVADRVDLDVMPMSEWPKPVRDDPGRWAHLLWPNMLNGADDVGASPA